MIFRIPWGHHIQILTKCKGNRDNALYFVRQTLKNNWSRAVLMNFLDTELYERDGKAITNFEKRLPGAGTDLANELTKDPYNFDFLTMRAGYDEKELKDALMNNIQKHCYVVIEIKTRAFEPGDMGQLGTYIAATDKTNDLLRKNSETLKMATIETAKEVERPIVDIETLRICSKNLVSSVNEVVKIHEQGSAKRVKAQEELVKIEEELKQAMLDPK